MDFRSKVVSSILTINVSVIAQATIQLEQTNLHRCGAGVARAAHNRKDIRSKRIAGIYHSGGFIRTRQRCLYSNIHPFSSAAEHPGS